MKSPINYHQYLKDKGMKPAFINWHDQENKRSKRQYSSRNPEKENTSFNSQNKNYDSLVTPNTSTVMKDVNTYSF